MKTGKKDYFQLAEQLGFSQREIKHSWNVAQQGSTVEHKARQAFFAMGEKKGFSRRFIKKNWLIYKHLPIKEGDSVLFTSPNTLLEDWLVGYGLASEVTTITSELNFGEYRPFPHKPYLPKIKYVDASQGSYDLMKQIDLVIHLDATNEDIHVLFEYLSEMHYCPKLYVQLRKDDIHLSPKRLFNAFKHIDSPVINKNISLDSYNLPNDVSHNISLVDQAENLIDSFPEVKINLVHSPLTKKNSYYRDMVIRKAVKSDS